MYKPDFKKYLRYDELVETLEKLVESRPDLARMYSIGKTYEGRDMWMVEISNREKGDPSRKPAMYIDGNHHAPEVTGSAACVYTIHYLLAKYGQDDFVTDLVDKRTFYILPRVCADGAEVFLTTPYNLRSSTRPWPPRESDDGLTPEDIDGDGLILQMRVKDPSGDWKVSSRDPRLMVKREPWDTEGEFYRVYPEGIIKNYDGKEIKLAPPKWGLDINRNYPANWEPEAGQRGAGPYPLSEPETRAVAEFILAHPNIGAAQTYHTTMGAILRPCCTKPDEKMPPLDVEIYKAIGRKGTELTGYPSVSTFEEYTADKSNPLKGVFMDWLYEHMGIIAFSTELWNAGVRAGNKLFDWKNAASEDAQLKLLKFNDIELAGKGFENWRKFNHPQLGEVEIGGWKTKFTITNPPPEFLEAECHKNMMFTLYHAWTLPLLAIEKAESIRVAGDIYKVTVKLRNEGFMPTNVSEQAVKAGKAKGIKVRIENAPVISPTPEQDIGQIMGLSSGGRRAMALGWGGGTFTYDSKTVEWVVRAPAGTRIRIVASSQKAGEATTEIILG